MSQVQVQTQVQNEDFLTLEYSTWGSCRINWKKAVLIDGTVVDPRKIEMPLSNGSKRVVELKVGDVCVEAIAEKWSSRKHDYYYVKIPRSVVLAVVYYHTTCSRQRIDLQGPGEIVEETGVEERVEGRYKYVRRYRAVYYVNKERNLRVEVFRFYSQEEKQLADKPRLYVRKSNNVIEVSGDTYHVKDKLKELKFKWNPDKKVWYHTDESALLYLTTFAEVVEQ